MKGTYILLIKMENANTIEIGKLGRITFQKGWYVYIGSALHSLEPRIKRHIDKKKKHHWHIDYLLEHASIISVFYKEGTKREECNIAKIFSDNFINIKNFGCSDCQCKSHLYHGKKDDLLCQIRQIKFQQFL